MKVAEAGAAPGPDSVAARLAAWCASTGTSMRSLSLELGANAKFVSDLVHGHSRNPDPVQTAIILLLEQTIVPRLGTLARTRLDRHLIRPRTRGGAGRVIYDPQDTKTGQPVQAELVSWKVRLIDIYVRWYRPVLASGPHDEWLFPGDSPARGKGRGAIAAQTRELVDDRLGVRINFHLLRKIFGSWLLMHTKDKDMVGALLGHADGSTVTRLYAELQAAWAAEALDQTLEKLLDRRAHTLLGAGR
jgi:hypothetical protein